jgi:transcriptional regulator with XRE-family HTH domain
MTIGQRILQAREEAGLSQRQVAGEHMTRNMLSFLEHDRAKPSLDTLIYLSGVLGKTVGYFLGEDQPCVAGFDALCLARQSYDAGAYRACMEQLRQIPAGAVLDRERQLLEILSRLSLAEQALADGRRPYARELLEQAGEKPCPYWTEELRRRLAILQAQAEDHPGALRAAVERIPEDGVLMLRAWSALEEGRYPDACRYLEAMDRRDADWYCRMGDALFGLGEYARAAECFHKAEETMPKAVRRKLQLCYARLKDFEQAYRYATMED